MSALLPFLLDGLQQVHPDTLIPHSIRYEDGHLLLINPLNGSVVYRLETGDRPLIVIGAGKASAAMASALEQLIPVADGLVTTKYGHRTTCSRIRITEAGHPVPDEAGVKAVDETCRLIQIYHAGHPVYINLLSGGASALWADPASGIRLQDLQELTRQLLHAGANIHEINTVRKHLSTLKGGQLCRLTHPHPLINLLVSDVTGDDPATIGSGPGVPDRGSFRDAWQILVKYQLDSTSPKAIQNHLHQGLSGQIPDTPKKGDPVFSQTYTRIIAGNRLVLQWLQREITREGTEFSLLQDDFSGTTDQCISLFLHAWQQWDGRSPVCYCIGGEPVLQVHGNGLGGRNQHLALQFLHTLWKDRRVETLPSAKWSFLSAGTDGTDGPTDATGAWIDDELLVRTRQYPQRMLDAMNQFDSYGFFKGSPYHIITGPTQTNVMDVVLLLLEPESSS